MFQYNGRTKHVFLKGPGCQWHKRSKNGRCTLATMSSTGVDGHLQKRCPPHPISDPVVLRLVNSSSLCVGRVEVLHRHEWGTVCGDSWDEEDATVVCQQLGCGMVVSAPDAAWFGQGCNAVWLDDVNCTGREDTLLNCLARPWGTHSCDHGEDACVVCSDPVASQRAPLRLSDGPHRCAGRVEVFYENRWGTVCDDHWDLEDAGVVCRQLGCGTALSAHGAGHFRAGSGPIWLDDVNCTGTEVALSYCRTKGWGKNNCHHGEDAGVVCSDSSSHHTAIHTSPTELRLVNGPNRCSGRVEVMHDHQWGTVCDDDWSFPDASVVCRQLGCGTAVSAFGGAHFGQGSGPIWLDNVQCSGTEAALSECLARPWGVNNCDHGEDASVICTGTATNTPARLRLENGPSHCAGRVEVLYHHQWGTVCDHGWSLAEAAVVCRELGCGTAISAPGSAHFGQGSGRIWLDNVNCTGGEATLSECPARPWGSNSCDHREDAGVVCSGTNPLQVRVKDGPGPCAGQVEVLYNATWHRVCGSSWSLLEAGVVCRQLGCGPAQSAPVRAQLRQGDGHALLKGLSCRGTESLLLECQQREMGPGPCRQGFTAGVVCTEQKDLIQSCSVLAGLLGMGAMLCGTLLVLYLWTRCGRRAGRSPDKPLIQKTEDTGTSSEA
ncbi:scavenger receptor cysteine-rich domain-containing protein DMBT1-like isoform 4-T4 [Theristicus caerulescens]